MKLRTLFTLLIATFMLTACNVNQDKTPTTPEKPATQTENTTSETKKVTSIDYTQSKNWIKFEKTGTKECDVFFVHPTTYPDKKEGMNASIETIESNDFTRQIVEKQAGAFGKTCNIYAPKYRQASISVLELSVKERKKYIDFARRDVEKAFEYYMKEINKGKPYFIAGHSQGSNIIKDMLVENTDIVPTKNLVGVYAIGYTITQKDINTIGIPLAVTPTQTPGIITWNVIGKGGKSPTIEEGALCINPLDWTDDKENQDKEKNIFADINGEKIPHFTSAQIDEKGALVIPTPKNKENLMMIMGDEVYHIHDYDFFYGNIQKNVADRVQAWKEKNKK
ncbi:DUF3089 domain-containing protein [Candidatus Gracilibacteria bacterium]|nr:DUF3089 domain-containing protein [Candidatus Gracilibacteria bacterium]